MKICLTGNSFRPLRPSGLITGFNVATADLMRSFIRYSEAEEIACLYEPKSLQQEELLKLIHGSEKRQNGSRCTLVDEYELFFGNTSPLKGMNVFHSVKEDAVPLLALRERVCSRVPLTFTLHCLAEQQLLSDLFLPLLLLPFRQYDAVICTSSAVRKSVDSILTQLEECWQLPQAKTLRRRIRLEQVPLGVDTSIFHPMDRAALRRQYNIAQDAFVILWFGRFSDLFKADLMPLLHVFKELLQANPQRDIQLILAGCEDGPRLYSKHLKNECYRLDIANRVHIIHNQDIPNRTELYCLSNVFTSPVDNIQETFGLTPVEAMACGVPQVVTDWDGYRDTVVNGETGYLTPTAWCNCLDEITQECYLPGDGYRRRDLHRNLSTRSVAVDCTTYRQQIQRLLDSPSLELQMAEASRKRAVAYFDLRHTVRKTEELWQELGAIALREEPSQSPMRMPTLDYCRTFQSYPTHWLTDETLFVLTDYGIHTPLCTDDRHSFYAHHFLDVSLLQQLLTHLHRYDGATIQGLILAFPSIPETQIRRSVMFLYKYDYLRPQT